MKTVVTVLLIVMCMIFSAHGQSIVRSTTGAGGSSLLVSVNGKRYFISQSIGQAGVIGTSSISGYTIRQGFQQPPSLLIVDQPFISEDLLPVIFPNPFTQEVKVAFTAIPEQDIYLKVFDITGRSQMEKRFSPSSILILSFESIPDGEYILNISTGQRSISKAIIKKQP